ncbi:MAG: molybdopterin-dependent oxidoreductase [Deltaproteobacteria bacterium]|jgi:nitrate reductase NapA|nr:molybdopterin-dependent oxidoreductase [Deltaproteobacteria bacterium]
MTISRRDFLKASAATLALSTIGLPGLAQAASADDPDKWVKGVCRYCGTGCGILIGVKNGKAVAVKGDPKNHNQGLLCLKGAMLVPVIYTPDRITEPMIRKGGKQSPLEKVSWDEALDFAAARFKTAIAETGPSSVAYYGSGQALTEESYLANKIWKAGLKSNNVDGNPRLCMASAVAGYLTTFGKDEPMGTYDDLDKATCFFIIGSNTSEAHPVLFRRIAKRKETSPDVKIIVADPRKTNTARIADLHLPFIAGTDLALLNGMAHIIVRDELDNPRFYNKYVEFKANDGKDCTFEDYKTFLAAYTPEAVSKTTGLPVADIEKAAKLFAEASATTSLWCMGINQRTKGVWANNLIHNLHLLTGKICRPGSTPLSLTGQPNACGGVRDTGSLAHLLPAGRMVENEKHRAEMEEFWGVPAGTIQPKMGLHTVALFENMLSGGVKAVFIHCTNPAHTLPNLNKLTKGLQTAFVAMTECFMSAETLKYADVVFPAAFWCETEGVYGCTERRYAITEQAIKPAGNARPVVQVLLDFAKRVGVDPKLIPYKDAADIWEEWRTLSAKGPYNFYGMTRARLKKESGLKWPCPTETHPGTYLRYVKGDDPMVPADHPDPIFFYGKPNGKVTIFLRPYQPPFEPADAEYPFVLTTGRVIDHWHSATMTGQVPELSKAYPSAFVEVNPDDAKKLNIANGDPVVLETRRDKMTFPARVTDTCMPGLVFCPFFDKNLLVNRLFHDAVDAASKEPEYKICATKVYKQA